MKVQLASSNRQIQTLCQETFSDIVRNAWTLHITTEHSAEIEADVYVWDVEPGTAVRHDIAPADRWRHFYLVHRDDVQRFREELPFHDANIILKPVTRAALLVFFSDACGRASSEAQPRSEKPVREDDSVRADRDEILQCLIQTNLKLQEYDHDRTNFLARAIHDFRAPLTAVTGYCSLLLSDGLGSLSAEQREVLERMQRSAKKLSRMANAMFQLSIAPRMEQTSECESGEIGDCIENAVQEIMPTAEDKRLSITVDTAPCPVPLYFERMKLEQVLTNLLDNACRFAPRGGSIEIRGYSYHWDPNAENHARPSAHSSGRRGEPMPNSYRVDIRDTGPGIPASQLPKIFEEYTSYGGGSDRSGGGLGLAICRMILNHHNGRIWAESRKEGATFSFVLPFRSSDMVPPPEQPSRKPTATNRIL